MNTATDKTIHETVQAMIGEIGKLRQLVAIDSMPLKLQQVRQLLRELDYDMEQRAAQDKLRGTPGGSAPWGDHSRSQD